MSEGTVQVDTHTAEETCTKSSSDTKSDSNNTEKLNPQTSPKTTTQEKGNSNSADKSPTGQNNATETKEDEENEAVEEEVTEGNWNTPHVEVHEVEVVTGEEGEEVFWKHRSKLYRWAKDKSEWKERGLGEARLLKNSVTGKIRFLLRQEKTLKIVANHYVVPSGDYCKLIPNVSSEKIWVWTVNDSAEGELKLEQFALKFGNVDQANLFKTKFEEAAAINKALFCNGGG